MGFLFFGKRDDEEENILDEINSELDAIKVKSESIIVPAGELTAQEQEWWFWICGDVGLKLDIGETYKIDGDKVTKTRRAR